MQYAPTHTGKKLGGSLADDSSAGYVLGRMQYASTLTGKKIDGLLVDDSPARYVLVRI